jgi:hypothetical protein
LSPRLEEIRISTSIIVTLLKIVIDINGFNTLLIKMEGWKGSKINFGIQQLALDMFITLLCEIMFIEMEDSQQQY